MGHTVLQRLDFFYHHLAEHTKVVTNSSVMLRKGKEKKNPGQHEHKRVELTKTVKLAEDISDVPREEAVINVSIRCAMYP